MNQQESSQSKVDPYSLLQAQLLNKLVGDDLAAINKIPNKLYQEIRDFLDACKKQGKTPTMEDLEKMFAPRINETIH